MFLLRHICHLIKSIVALNVYFELYLLYIFNCYIFFVKWQKIHGGSVNKYYYN